MGTFSRLRYVIAANVNALLEKAEDPEKLLRALIREMQDAGDEARAASAELLAEQRHLRRRAEDLDRDAGQWQTRAERAVAEGRDDLARTALAARSAAGDRADGVRRDLQHVDERLAALESDTATLQRKLAAASQRLQALARRPAGTRPNASARSMSPAEARLRRAFGRFDRLQTQVETLEARVQSYELGGAAPAGMADRRSDDPDVEAALEQLKRRVATPADTAA